RLVDVGASFVADAQTAVLVQPGDRALDHPALGAEARSVLLFGSRDGGADPTGAQLLTVAARVVGAVAEQPVRSAPGQPAVAGHGRDRIHEREQLDDVVVVRGAERERERGAPSAGERMVLGAA